LLLVTSPHSQVSVVALHQEHSRPLAVKLKQILEAFLEDFPGLIEGNEANYVRPSLFDSFRSRIIKTFAQDIVSSWWVPFVKTRPSVQPLDALPHFKLIDGQQSIAEICEQVDLDGEKVREDLYLWWNRGLLEFKNILDATDVVITNSNTQMLFSTADPIHKRRHALYPTCRDNCQSIVKKFDGKTSVKDLTIHFGSSCQEFLECLWENDFIEILSPEKRRILIAKEITEKILETLKQLFSKTTVIQFARETVEKVYTLEIASELNITANDVNVDLNFKNYEDLSPKEVLERFKRWMNFNRTLISRVPSPKRRRVIEKLGQALTFEFFENFRGEDMEELEDFTGFLEELMR
ncbi:MAG: hypothetical protein ACFFBD_10210, partial [Candidatus Hodarchaeota archaeon]